MNEKQNIDYVIPNEQQLTQINNDAKKHTTTIENILKTKLKYEFDNANIDFYQLKLYCDFDLFKNNDYYFTGLFKYDKDIYEVIQLNNSNKVVIINKDNKKEFTKKYLMLCDEITNIGETLFIDNIHKLELKISNR
jgi:hypothetical protein